MNKHHKTKNEFLFTINKSVKDFYFGVKMKKNLIELYFYKSLVFKKHEFFCEDCDFFIKELIAKKTSYLEMINKKY